MREHSETIVALVSGPPPAAVAVVRVSGPDAHSVAAQVFAPWPEPVAPLRALYGRFAHGDDGLALPFAEGRSYTGEASVELSVHGSRASIDALLDACLRAGARAARPGEFTLRAFLNGRLDLTQAEAVRDCVEAETAAQLRVASRNREGALRRAVEPIRDGALDLLARIEASVDFSEEIGETDPAELARTADDLARSVAAVLEEGRRAEIARSGVRVALVGRPNAGKSSLLNALLGRERALVAETPGTTRDFLEETVDFAGVRVVLVDTAGLRECPDPVERLGVARSLAHAETADEVWYVYDAAQGWSQDDAAFVARFEARARVLANKSDLALGPVGEPVSARTGAGLTKLVDSFGAQAAESGALGVNDRQRPLLEAAGVALEEAAERAAAFDPPDLVAVLVRDALLSLGEVLGDAVGPDVLDAVFSRFCIGK